MQAYQRNMQLECEQRGKTPGAQAAGDNLQTKLLIDRSSQGEHAPHFRYLILPLPRKTSNRVPRITNDIYIYICNNKH